MPTAHLRNHSSFDKALVTRIAARRMSAYEDPKNFKDTYLIGTTQSVTVGSRLHYLAQGVLTQGEQIVQAYHVHTAWGRASRGDLVLYSVRGAALLGKAVAFWAAGNPSSKFFVVIQPCRRVAGGWNVEGLYHLKLIRVTELLAMPLSYRMGSKGVASPLWPRYYLS